MRVLFFGDMAPSGFGTVTMDIGRRLIDLGVDVRFVSQNDLGSAPPEPLGSRTVDMRTFAQTVSAVTGLLESNEVPANIIDGLLRGKTQARLYPDTEWGDWTPDAAVILADFTAARIIASRGDFGIIPTWHYVPIEGVGLPPSWADTWSVLTPVAISEFGAEQIQGVTGTRPPVIYHGVDTEAFHPVSGKDPIILSAPGQPDVRLTTKAACKQLWAAWFGLPVGKKWMLRTDRHMPRKRYNSMLRGLAPVLYRNPDASLVIHCAAFDQGGYLPDSIRKLPGARALNQPSEDRPQQGWALFDRRHAQILLTDSSNFPRPALVSLYNAADLYVSTSAEGFGLTVAEALACGVPAVGLDYSAVPEVIGPAGVCVQRAYLIENEYDHFWAAIDEDELAKRAEFLITHQSRREALGKKGPAHIAAHFDWDNAARQFSELLHAAVVTRQAA